MASSEDCDLNDPYITEPALIEQPLAFFWASQFTKLQSPLTR